MTPQELKNSILQLAIQGRLVEQRPEEGTAEELYRQIQREKAALVKTGKIKKEKPLPEITEEEVPFEIPEGWKWVRYSELFEIGSAIRIHQTDWKKEGIPFFRGRELVRLAKTGNPDAEIFISHELYETNKAKGGVPQKGDLLVTAVGTLGKVYIVKGTQPFYYKDAYILRYNNFAKLFSEYFKYVIESPFIQGYISQGSMGTTVAQLTIEKAKKMLCPLPPFAEQKRIVSKIEELLPYIDRYEVAWSRLEDFNKRFPTDMQKSILQFAIQGKLVPQRPEEGTGEELYQQIQTEKQSLIRSGKLKKEKPLPEIYDAEIPFDIPESWKWVRIGELVECITSGSRDWAKYYSDEGDKFIRMGNLSRNSFRMRLDKIQHVKAPENTEGQRTSLQEGDLLFSITAEIGMLGLIPADFGKAYINQHTAMIRFVEILRNRYLPFVLMTDYAQKYYNGNQHGIKNSFRLDRIATLPIPLPPLAEQKRIVAKLEKLLPLCERLK